MEDKNILPGPFGQRVEITIEKAKNGDAESARKILSWFCGAIKANTAKDGKPHTGTRIDERILRYLGECFQEILGGGPGARVDADRALGLNSGQKGNKKTKKGRQQTLDLGYEVKQHHNEIKAKRRNKFRGRTPLDTAISEVAKKNNKSEQTVRDAYDEWNKAYKANKFAHDVFESALKEVIEEDQNLSK